MGYEVLLIRAAQQDYDRLDGTISMEPSRSRPKLGARIGRCNMATLEKLAKDLHMKPDDLMRESGSIE